PEPAVPAYRRLRMHRKHPQVLGADLNRSESRIAFRALDCCQCRKGTFLAIRLSICRSKPVIERHSAASGARRSRSYVCQCMPFGLSGNAADMTVLPMDRLRAVRWRGKYDWQRLICAKSGAGTSLTNAPIPAD